MWTILFLYTCIKVQFTKNTRIGLHFLLHIPFTMLCFLSDYYHEDEIVVICFYLLLLHSWLILTQILVGVVKS